jgi:DNA-binding MurR/RpiR family transcriptional regulator
MFDTEQDGPPLRERLVRALDDGLPRQRHQLARYILDNTVTVALSSAQEIGVRTGVSTATVVRFAKAIGYSGFPEMRKAAQAETPGFLTAAEKTLQHLRQPGSDAGAFDPIQAYAQDIRNLEETAATNPPEDLIVAANRLSSARMAYVLGFGRTAYFADALAHQLTLLGVTAESGHRDIAPSAARIRQLTTHDVLVVISVWRYLRSSVYLLEHLKEPKPYTIAITDSRASPVANLCDTTLITVTRSRWLTHGLTSLYATIELLVSGVAAKAPSRAVKSLENVEDAYRRLDLITRHDSPREPREKR